MNHISIIFHCSGPDDNVLLPRILSFLSWDELVLTIRLVNKSWKQAVTFTPVGSFPYCPPASNNNRKIQFVNDQFSILLDEARLAKLVETLPRLQKILSHGKILSQDALSLIVNGFKELKSLDIHCRPPPSRPNNNEELLLYYGPVIMTRLSSLESLVELDVSQNPYVKLLNLKQHLSKLTQLKSFQATGCGDKITGHLSQLQVLTELQVCDLEDCVAIEGDVRDLAITCPKLLYLGLRGTNVDGRLMDLQPGDYPSLIYLDWIHGGSKMEQEEAEQSTAVDIMEGTIRDIFLEKDLARVSSAPLAVQRVFDLAAILPCLRLDLCKFALSKGSPDYYTKPNRSSSTNGLWSRNPPFQVELIQIQNRRGWRWTNGSQNKKGVCEITWIDPFPHQQFETNRKQHALYLLELQLIGHTDDSIYQGWFNPPTEEEHNDLMYKKLIAKRRRARRLQREEEEG